MSVLNFRFGHQKVLLLSSSGNSIGRKSFEIILERFLSIFVSAEKSFEIFEIFRKSTFRMSFRNSNVGDCMAKIFDVFRNDKLRVSLVPTILSKRTLKNFVHPPLKKSKVFF